MREGYDVRISGQDVGRGTFSQRWDIVSFFAFSIAANIVSFTALASFPRRHAMLVDQKTEQAIVPLNDNVEGDGRLELANSEEPFILVTQGTI